MQNTITKTVQLHDKKFTEYISAVEINAVVQKIAGQINSELEGKNPLFICVLNGVFVFAADLLRAVTIPCGISFVKVSSYEGLSSTGEVKTQIGLQEELKGRTVVVVEDIIDTGKTVDNLLNIIKKEGPAQVKVAALLHKPSLFKKDYRIDYVGIEIPDTFVVGYGLDYNGLGRNLPELYKLSEY